MDPLEKAKKAIQDMYADTSVSRGKTKSNLEALRDEIDLLLATLDDAESEED